MAGSLTIGSFGMTLEQLSWETLEAARDADVVYSQSLGSREDDPSREFLKKLCPGARLAGAAGPGGSLADAVLEELRAGRRVLYLTYGHPLFLSAGASELAARCHEEGFACRTQHAVSSLDMLLPEVGAADLRYGMFLAAMDSWSEGCRRPSLRADVPTLVFCLDSAGRAAREHLLEDFARAYPPEHPVEVLRCPSLGSSSFSRECFSISRLREALARAGSVGTIYVPASFGPPRIPSLWRRWLRAIQAARREWLETAEPPR